MRRPARQQRGSEPRKSLHPYARPRAFRRVAGRMKPRRRTPDVNALPSIGPRHCMHTAGHRVTIACFPSPNQRGAILLAR
jgi:hypothetical protein